MQRKIVICDDEVQMIEDLEAILKRIEEATGDEYKIKKFYSGEELIKDFPSDAELLFLDIRMGELNGMDVARQLRKRYEELYLVFTTSFVEYALEGYDVHAFAFLTKPLKEEAVQRQITDIFGRIDEKKNSFITLKYGNAADVINVNDIIYAEVYHHDTVITLMDSKGLFCKKEYVIPLNVIEEQTKKWDFFRCHKSYLINMKRIARIENTTLMMEGGEQIPISKHRKKEFMAAYTRAMGEYI